MRTQSAPCGIGWLLCIGLALAPAAAAQQEKAKEDTARPSIYDEHANARSLVDAALKQASRDHSRVLVMLGGNWCGWCHKLHDLFQTNGEIRKALRDEYQLVMLDTRAPHAEELMAEWKVDTGKGVPYLVVLDRTGAVVTRQETGALEEGDHHDPKKVLAFLNQHKADPVDAQSVLKAALDQAASQDKRVFLHFGAPWCGWCHKLEDFLAQPDIAAIMQRDFIDLKIDVDRMTGGKELLATYPHAANAGIPWMVVLDPAGKSIITSESTRGNVGYPVEPHEIEHFVKMLETATRRTTPEQIEHVERALKEAAEKIRSAR